MGWRSARARKRALACIAVLGVGGIAGLAAGFSADGFSADSMQTSELSPAEIVALRFPGGTSRTASIHIAPAPIASDDTAAPSTPAETQALPGPAGYLLASAAQSDASSLMFNPFPTYSAPTPSAPVNAPTPAPRPVAQRPAAPHELPAELVTASVEIPAQALAYAVPGADEPAEIADVLAAAPARAAAAPGAAKRPVQPPRPAVPASASNAVLNSAQIASIKERLKLTSYQSQLWPPVESALRDISYQGRPEAGGRKLASNARGGTIDPSSVPVQRLKSAAFPLIMSLSEDQKQEVRTMVRLMGLENLASQF